MKGLHFLKHHYLILSLSTFYFFIRTIYLTSIPIFNDEAIYLDWGWRETHVPGYLYYSLYDAKQPLLMWFFGISQSIFTDPLFAGRIVSVVTGYASMMGIYAVGKRFFGQKAALIGSSLYIITPIFSFFDRQALMESAITAIGIWAYYLHSKLVETAKGKYAVMLGAVLGVGFFIKSTTLVFVLIILLLSGYYLVRYPKKRRLLLKEIVIVFSVFVLIDVLLLIQPEFWNTFHTNSRYSLSLPELFHFPVSIWLRNLVANMQIAFFYVTPFIFLGAIVGLVMLFKTKTKQLRLYCVWLILGLLLQILVSRFASQRYSVTFFPLLLPPAAYFLWEIIKKNKVVG